MAEQEAFVASGDSATGESAETDKGAADPKNGGPGSRNLETILRIPVVLQVVLGSTSMSVANLLKIGRGAVIPLDRRIGEPVDVTVNGRIVARGEVVVVEDDHSRFGISLTEIVGPPGFTSNG